MSNGSYYEGYWPITIAFSLDESNKLTDPEGEKKGKLLKIDVVSTPGVPPGYITLYHIGFSIARTPARQSTPAQRREEQAGGEIKTKGYGYPTANQIRALRNFRVAQSEIDLMTFEQASESIRRLKEEAYGSA